MRRLKNIPVEFYDKISKIKRFIYMHLSNDTSDSDESCENTFSTEAANEYHDKSVSDFLYKEVYNTLFPLFMNKDTIKKLQNFSSKFCKLNVTKKVETVMRDIIAGIDNLKTEKAREMVNDSSLIQNVDFSDYPVLVQHNIPVTHDFIHQQVLRELLKWNLKIRNQRSLRVSN